MSLGLSRFEFSNDKFTVYLAVPPFIPKTSASDDSIFQPDHLFLFGLEPYSSEVYNDQLKTVLAQTEEFLQGLGSFDKEVIISNCGKVLERQKRSRPLQYNVLPMPSVNDKTKKSKPFKGATNQAERTRKLKVRQSKAADFSNKENVPLAKKTPTPQNKIPKAASSPEREIAEATESNMKSQPKNRPKTHFRKSKKPGKV